MFRKNKKDEIEKKHNDLEKPEAGIYKQAKKLANKKNKYLTIIVITLILIGIVVFISISLALKRADLIELVFYQVLLNNILAVPSILIGLVVFLGYLLQKRSWFDAISGAIKGIVGYLILQMGSAFLTGISKPIMQTFGSLMGSKVVILDTYTGWSEVNEALGKAVSVISYVVLVGLAFNILLVALKKITNVKSINVTGHIMFQQASCLVAVMWFFVFKSIENDATKQLATILVTGIMIGTYWGVFSTLAYGPTQKITRNAGFSIGHQQMLGAWIVSQTGKLFNLNGKEIKSVENMKMKKGFRIFHDSIFTSSLLMFIFFGLLFIIIRFSGKNANGDEYWDVMIKGMGSYNLFGDKMVFIQIIGFIISIVASIQIIMIGARMFVAELQHSFIGISNKLIPGAVIGIDIAGLFSFGEKAVTYGFVAGAIGNFIGIGLVVLLGQAFKIELFSVIVMVGFIPMFFDNAALGLYANSTGGWKACIIIPFAAGILIVFGAVFIIKTAGRTNEIFTYSYNGLFDWTTMWAVIMGVLSLVPSSISMYLTIIVIVGFLVVGLLITTEPGKSTKFKAFIFKKWVQKDNERAILLENERLEKIKIDEAKRETLKKIKLEEVKTN